MNRKHLTFALLATVLAMSFSSCNKDNDTPSIDGGWSGYYGFPCHAHNLLAIAGEVPSVSSSYTMEKPIDGNVDATEFAITAITYDTLDATIVPQYYEEASSFDIGFGVIQNAVRDVVPEVEKAVDTYVGKTRAIMSALQYRFEGVSSFSITASKEFNGIAAGKELTHCFHIVCYSPPFVFNYVTYELRVLDEWRKDNIADWLAMKPLAQPGMTLMIKEESLSAANDIAFTIAMTLTDGRVLTATTSSVNIVH